MTPLSRTFAICKIGLPRFLSSKVPKPKAIRVGLSLQPEEIKTSLKETIKRLEKLLKVRPFKALDIASNVKELANVPYAVLDKNYKKSIENGVVTQTIVKYPHILAVSDLSEKTGYLKELSYDINYTYPLLALPLDICKYADKQKLSEKILGISKILHLDIDETCQSLAAVPALISIDLTKITTNIDLLQAYGISKNEIRRDLWVLTYRSGTIRERLEFAKENNVEVFKTWMVRTKFEILERHIKKHAEHKLLLGNNSLPQFLSERLDISEDLAKYILNKQPTIQQRSVTKLNEMIDFLFANGFESRHIWRVPKILLHSMQTCEKRLKELRAVGVRLDGLSILTKSQKQYNQYLESCKKKKLSENI